MIVVAHLTAAAMNARSKATERQQTRFRFGWRKLLRILSKE